MTLWSCGKSCFYEISAGLCTSVVCVRVGETPTYFCTYVACSVITTLIMQKITVLTWPTDRTYDVYVLTLKLMFLGYEYKHTNTFFNFVHAWHQCPNVAAEEGDCRMRLAGCVTQWQCGHYKHASTNFIVCTGSCIRNILNREHIPM